MKNKKKTQTKKTELTLNKVNNKKNKNVNSRSKSNDSVKKVKKLKKKKLLVSLIIFILSVILLFLYIINQNEANHQPKLKTKKIKKPEVVEVKEDPKLKEIKDLYSQNNDLALWLKIDGTRIDYPVMYTKDQDFYLYRDFYKNDYKPGSLYIDKHNTIDPRDINLIVHGHNMRDGSMFADIIKYKDQNYYNEHKKITVYTLDEKEEYEVIAVFLSRVYNVNDNVFKYYKFYGQKTEQEYNDYIKNIKKLSLYNIETSATYPEKLITLSTCEYSTENGRMVLVAKKISNN